MVTYTLEDDLILSQISIWSSMLSLPSGQSTSVTSSIISLILILSILIAILSIIKYYPNYYHENSNTSKFKLVNFKLIRLLTILSLQLKLKLYSINIILDFQSLIHILYCLFSMNGSVSACDHDPNRTYILRVGDYFNPDSVFHLVSPGEHDLLAHFIIVYVVDHALSVEMCELHGQSLEYMPLRHIVLN